MLPLSLQKNIEFKKDDAHPEAHPTHPSRDSEGHPLNGFDEVDNLAET